jgi:hypothetical protein
VFHFPSKLTATNQAYQCHPVPSSHPHDSDYVITRVRYDTTTSNLVNHRDACEKQAKPKNSITQYTQGGNYNKGLLRLQETLWVSRRHRPFCIVKDPELQGMFRAANSNVILPSPWTVSRDVVRVYEASIPVIAAALQERAKKNFLHLSFDGWTAANVLSFFGICVHYANDVGDMVSITLDFLP